jgi:hypothetical protein
LIEDNLSTDEYKHTQELIDLLRPVRQRKYMTKGELVQVCRWKSARVIQKVKANSQYLVRSKTATAFETRSERQKLIALTDLHGVSVPMASAVLMLTNPRRYGVIDIRVWELMYKLGVMSTLPKGVGFRFNHWYRYLMILRYFAKKHHVRARDIERTLFEVHKKYQKGRLYAKLDQRSGWDTLGVARRSKIRRLTN